MKHIISQHHNMDEDEGYDDDFIMGQINHGNATACCLKQTIKNYIREKNKKKVSYVAALLLYIYQMLVEVIVCCTVVYLNIVERSLLWGFAGVLGATIIQFVARVINGMLIIQMVQEVGVMVIALLCDCE
jgi:hypothetical protein